MPVYLLPYAFLHRRAEEAAPAFAGVTAVAGGSASTCRATAFDKTVGEILVGAIAGEEFEDCDAGAGTAHPNRERSGVSRTTGQGSR